MPKDALKLSDFMHTSEVPQAALKLSDFMHTSEIPPAPAKKKKAAREGAR